MNNFFWIEIGRAARRWSEQHNWIDDTRSDNGWVAKQPDGTRSARVGFMFLFSSPYHQTNMDNLIMPLILIRNLIKTRSR